MAASPRSAHPPVGTFAFSSASHATALASEGIRQSPRGLMVPPARTLSRRAGPGASNWLAKNRLQKTSTSAEWPAGRTPCAWRPRVAVATPYAGVVPRVPGQEGDLAGRHAAADGLVQREVLQRVGPDGVLGRLRLDAVGVGDQLGGHSRSRISPSTSLVSASNWSSAITQRIRVLDQRRFAPRCSRRSATSGRRRRTCTSRARAPTGRRFPARTPRAGWRAETGSRCAAPPARSRT